MAPQKQKCLLIIAHAPSPNTRRLRDALAAGAEQEAERLVVRCLSPFDTEVEDVLGASGVDAVIATNTTVSRPPDLRDSAQAGESGGLSGRPLCRLAESQLAQLRAQLDRRVAIIGVGGIHDEASAARRYAAGADLLQVYTGFVYRGPALLREAVRAARAG